MRIPIAVAVMSALLIGARAAAAQAPASDRAELDAVYARVEPLYEDLHRNPELAFHETRTAATLAARMKALGYDVTTGVGGTGIVAVMKNGAGPTAMLRTELDALPIEEKTGLPFASKATTKNDAGDVVPVAHMCGHDLHMTAWAATAELMAKHRERWHGTLLLVGQPAEETIAGARAMLDAGLFTRFGKPDFVLGLHDEQSLSAGTIGYHAGFFRAASTSIDLTVYGRGGHGAYPQATVDPIVLAARIIVGLQTLVSRENDPLQPAVVSVGSIHGGTVWNIIPEQVKLQLTVRSLEPEVHRKLIAGIEREARGEASAANAPKPPALEIRAGTDAVYNDPELTNRAAATARAVLGDARVVEMPVQMGGEDFSQFQRAGARVVLLHVGAVDADKLEESRRTGVPVPGVHTPQWAPVLEPTLKAAVATEVAILDDWLH